jgi:aspartate aminotransferase-like enzyme
VKSLLLIPGPVAVAEPVLAAMSRPMINHRGPEFAQLLARLEEQLRRVFGTRSDVVLLGGSGTSGLEAAIACSFSAGQRVLVAPLGAFGWRLAEIARIYKLDVEILETPLGDTLDPAALAERLERDRERAIDGILLTQNETSTGVQSDLSAIARVTQRHPATTIVDSISGLAASEFSMDEWGFDLVVGASQKALAAPPGAAMVAVSPRAWERMSKTTGARFYLDLAKARKLATGGQTPWTPPVSVLFALDVALEMYEATGPEKVWARHARYAEAIRAAVRALGLELLSLPGAHSNTVLAIRVPEGITGHEVGRALREDHGVVIGGGQEELKGKIWRIGTMGDISEVDLIGALAAFERVLRDNGWRAEPGVAAAGALASLENARELVAAK